VLVAIAVVSGGVAAAIPTQTVPESGLFVDLGRLPVVRGQGVPMAMRVDGHDVSVRPPAGYAVVQVGEGGAGHAHVTLAPVGGIGDTIVIRFEAPEGIDEGSVVGSRDGAPVHETRFGLLWRPPSGLTILVSGAGQSAQLATIDGIEISG
jgi:hypothetical protein